MGETRCATWLDQGQLIKSAADISRVKNKLAAGTAWGKTLAGQALGATLTLCARCPLLSSWLACSHRRLLA